MLILLSILLIEVDGIMNNALYSSVVAREAIYREEMAVVEIVKLRK